MLLVVNAHGAARSLAATVQGFARFEPGVRVAGVIANQGGSERHRGWLAESLAAAAAPPLLGMLPRGSLPTLPSRHLGLVTAEQANLAAGILDQLADACDQHLDVPAIVELARSCEGDRSGSGPNRTAVAVAPSLGECPLEPPTGKLRLGIARDEAFHFYYADNLESLARAGVEWVPFSPLADARLPRGPGRPVLRRRLSRGPCRPLERKRGDARRRPRSSPPRAASSMPSAAG